MKATLQRDLLAWYAAAKRDLPWRRTRDPWSIWVSEIMLQQTRVDTVVPYWHRFVARFPTPLALAEAPEDEVLSLWSGLGYYRRARLLQKGARAVAGGAIPSTRDELVELPGIGRYTAGAIASIAFSEPVGLVDGNVARVFARLFAIDDDMRGRGMRRAEALADELVPKDAPGDWNQALMELGSEICTPRKPACERCPVRSSCEAHAQGRAAVLPVLREKTRPKPQPMQALVARTSDDRVLLVRRHSGGLFGGLWEPPMLEGDPTVLGAFFRLFGVSESTGRARVVHVLSHRRLTVDVHSSMLKSNRLPRTLPDAYEKAALFEPSALDALGMSTLARKLLRAGS